MGTIELEICGKSYKITSDKDEQTLRSMTSYLKNKIRAAEDTLKFDSSGDLLVMTLLTVIEEYWDLREEHEKINSEIDEIEKTIERHL